MLRLLCFLALFVSATVNANLVEDLRSGSSIIIMRQTRHVNDRQRRRIPSRRP